MFWRLSGAHVLHRYIKMTSAIGWCVNCIPATEVLLSLSYSLPDKTRAEGIWHSPLNDCGGGCTERCLYTHFLFCCAAGEIASRIPGPPPGGFSNLCCGNAYATDCCLGGLLGCGFCFNCIVWAPTRSRMRMVYNIPGSSLADHIITFLFPTCFLVQGLNHLDAMGNYVPPPSVISSAQPPTTTVVLIGGQPHYQRPYQLPVAMPVQSVMR